MSFRLIAFTNRGRALQAKAQAGAQLNFTRIAVGDGQLSGQAIADLTALLHEVKSITLNKFKVLPGGKAVVGGVLSNQDIETGFWWRELGLFAQDPDLGEILYCYGNAGELAEYIPSPGGAEILEKQVDIVSVIGNAQNVSASIEQSLVYATVQDLTAHKEDHEKHIDYAVASGADDYIITIPGITQLVEGMSIKVKFTNANTGACTLNINGIGAVSIKKSNGNDLAASNIKAGQICHLVYTGSVFQLLGEGGGEYGTALPEHVLEGYSIGTENGIVDGNMPNNGPISAETITLTQQNEEYTIPKGFHSGLRKVKAVISGLVAGVIKAGVTVGGIVGTFTSDATATASRILTGFTAWVNGVLVEGTMPDNGDQSGVLEITGSNPVSKTLPAGYTTGGTIIAKLASALASVIKKGVTIGGVTGTYEAYAVNDYVPLDKIQQAPIKEWEYAGYSTIVSALDMDAAGNVYAGCRGSADNYAVKKISPTGGLIWTYLGHTGVIYDIAVDANGNVYTCAGYDDASVRKISPEGALIWKFTGFTKYVQDIAIDGNGYIYAVGPHSNDEKIKKISPSGGEVWSINQPECYHLDVDNAGNIYVRYIGTQGGMAKYDTNGNIQWWVNITGYPTHIAVSKDGQHLYVCTNANMHKCDPTNGTILWSFYSHRDSNGVKADHAGRAYYYPRSAHVFCIAPTGRVLWGIPIAMENDCGIGIKPDGSRVCVSDKNFKILEYYNGHKIIA